MIINYKNKRYEAKYNVKENLIFVEDGNDEINEIINKPRIQSGLLLGYLLNNPFYNLDETLKNNLL